MKRSLSVLFVLLTLSCVSRAQVDASDLQSWNDFDITVSLSDKVHLYAPFGVRFTKDISRTNELRAGLGLSFKLTKALTVTPFHQLIRVRNRAGSFYTENRSALRVVYRFPQTFVDISHRSQLELRVRPSGTTWRYRPSIKIEKELPKRWANGVKLFLQEEPFYDSASGRFSRNRISGGLSKKLNGKLTLDLYYLRQGDNFSSPGTVHVVGTNWKVRL